jgi:hypothetical protein
VVQFAQFNGGVFGLGGAAAAENVNFFYLGGFKALVDVVGDFGDVEFVGGFREDAGDVQGDVADADNGYFFGVEGPLAGEFGLAVVPGDEFGGAVGSV